MIDGYIKEGYPYYAQLKLNAHNQFLETQLTWGIPGTVLLILMLFAPAIRRWNVYSRPLYVTFLIILITAFLFESVLVRQWGIMFYSVFYLFQITQSAENKELSAVISNG